MHNGWTKEKTDKQAECHSGDFRGGDLITPCFGLAALLNERHSTVRGLVASTLTCVEKDSPHFNTSRTLVIARSGDHAKRGLVINFCPACGKRLYDPEKDRDTAKTEVQAPEIASNTKRHPVAVANDVFKKISGPLYEASTLHLPGTRDNADTYLGNRLDAAFQAGWDACAKHLKKRKK